MLAFPFVGLVFLCSLCYFLLLLFDKSSCYVMVFVLLFWVSLVWLCVLSCVFFWFVIGLGFFWRVQGSGEVAQRATSIGPKPSLFVLFCFWFVLF